MTYAEIYGRLVRFYRGERQFYSAIVSKNLKKGARILVTPSTTGWLPIALARRGYCCLGVDLDGEMVGIAQKKLLAEQRTVRLRAAFRTGNMCTILSPRKFDAVVVPQRGLLCLPPENKKTALACWAKLLRKNGLLIFDVSENQTAPLFRYRHKFSSVAVAETVRRQDGRVIQKLSVDAAGEIQRIILELWYPHQKELKLALAQTGFEVLSLYGDFLDGEYNKSSRYQVWICRKK